MEIQLLHFQNAQMPACERQRGEPGLSEEMNFDSRLTGTIRNWWLVTTACPERTHCCLCGEPIFKAPQWPLVNFSLFPQALTLPVHLSSHCVETKGHLICSIPLKTPLFSALLPPYFNEQFPGFFPRPVSLLVCLAPSFPPPQDLTHLVKIQLFRNKYVTFSALNILWQLGFLIPMSAMLGWQDFYVNQLIYIYVSPICVYESYIGMFRLVQQWGWQREKQTYENAEQ